MPELPEVETVRRGLETLLLGRTVTDFQLLEPKLGRLAGEAKWDLDLVGNGLTAIRRRGKVLIIDLSSHHSLVVHLKMTGQMVVVGPDHPGQATDRWGAGHPTQSLVGQLPDRSTRAIFVFDDDSRLFFNDQRKFGWLQLVPTDQVDQIDLLATMGPEPLDGDPWTGFRDRIRRHRATSIKAALLNQSVIAGIGNIYADEACWAARVHPGTKVASLSDRKLKAVLEGAVQAMRQSLAVGGSTDRNYVDAEGRRGAYLDFANVFRKNGQPCSRCQTTLIKTRVAGRGTHLCPRCQRPVA